MPSLGRFLPEARDRRGLAAGIGVALLFAGLFALWTQRAPLVGLANNGDWYRYTCAVDLVPQPDVSFTEVPIGLVPGECFAESDPYDSSFLLALRGARWVDDRLTGPPLTVRFLSLGWGAIAAAGWGWLAYELVRVARRPAVPSLAVAGAVVVAADVSFTAYFASAYAEAAVFALAPAVAAGVAHLVVRRRPSWLAVGVLAVASVFVTTTKPQMALTALLVVAAVALARRSRWTVLVPAAVVAVASAGYALGFIADEAYEEANEVNLVFTAALVETDEPAAFLEDLGVPESEARQLARFEGRGFWPIPDGPASSPAYPVFEEEVERNEVLARIASEPLIGVRMVETAVDELGEPRLDYLAHHRDPGSEGFSTDRPAPASFVLGVVDGLPWFLVPLVWVVAAVVALRAIRPARSGVAAGAALALVLIATASSQTLLSVADGYYELTKHLVVGHYAHAVAVAAGVGSVLGLAIDEALRRRRADERSADDADGTDDDEQAAGDRSEAPTATS